MMDRMRRHLCQEIKRLREDRGWSKTELARRAGINHCVVVRAETYLDAPSACATVMLAKTLGLTVEQLCVPGASFTHA